MSIFDRILGQKVANGSDRMMDARKQEFHDAIQRGQIPDRNLYMPASNTRGRESYPAPSVPFDRQQMVQRNINPQVSPVPSVPFDRQQMVQSNINPQAETGRSSDLRSPAYVTNIQIADLKSFGNPRGDKYFPVMCPKLDKNEPDKVGWVRAEPSDIRYNRDGTCDISLNRDGYRIYGMNERGQLSPEWHSLSGRTVESYADDYSAKVYGQPVLRLDKGEFMTNIGTKNANGSSYVPMSCDLGQPSPRYPGGVGYVRFNSNELEQHPFDDSKTVVTMNREFYGIKYRANDGAMHNTRGLHPEVVARELLESKVPHSTHVSSFSQMAAESVRKFDRAEAMAQQRERAQVDFDFDF